MKVFRSSSILSTEIRFCFALDSPEVRKSRKTLHKRLNGVIEKVSPFSDQKLFITGNDMLICLMTLYIPLN